MFGGFACNAYGLGILWSLGFRVLFIRIGSYFRHFLKGLGFVKQINEMLSYVYGLWSLVFLKDVILLSELTVVPYLRLVLDT
jgi:cytochrome c biogenesis protein CcdA